MAAPLPASAAKASAASPVRTRADMAATLPDSSRKLIVASSDGSPATPSHFADGEPQLELSDWLAGMASAIIIVAFFLIAVSLAFN
jgi:hypothetical protein